jgi:hypothetical protein
VEQQGNEHYSQGFIQAEIAVMMDEAGSPVVNYQWDSLICLIL